MTSLILIVDDDRNTCLALEAMLDSPDYRLILAHNGADALEMAAKYAPDLVLLDIMMPGMDGFEVCRRMRADERLREAPVLILTALDDHQSLLEGLRAGADDFLAKPVDTQELRARVATITRLNRYRLLLNQRENLNAMAMRVIHAQEEERLRIARELHDDLGQELTALRMQMAFLLEKIPDTLPEVRQAFFEQIEDVSKLFTRLHQVAQDLRPVLLETLEVSQALQAYCSDFSRRSGLPIHFDCDEPLPTLQDAVNVTLYRILQEALSNIVRHAAASQAWVSLIGDENELSLTIQDDGKGMLEPGQLGLGILGMQERVMLVGGKIDLRSIPGQGTILSVRFPYQGNPEKAIQR